MSSTYSKSQGSDSAVLSQRSDTSVLSAHHVGSISILKALTLFLSPIGRIRLCRLRFDGQLC